jgi:hypothetical protein
MHLTEIPAFPPVRAGSTVERAQTMNAADPTDRGTSGGAVVAGHVDRH